MPWCPAKDSECTSFQSTRKTSTTQTLLPTADAEADITEIGPKHLDSLGIPRYSLSPPPVTDVLTEDGSSMHPALGCFESTFQLGQASCKAIVHVHEGIQTPLLLYGHCVGLAIVYRLPKPHPLGPPPCGGGLSPHDIHNTSRELLPLLRTYRICRYWGCLMSSWRPALQGITNCVKTPDHDQGFGKVKAALLLPPVLAPINLKLPVILQTDPFDSMEHSHDQLRLVQCGSWFLTDAESRYATIEVEMLAASWAMGKCCLYHAGLQHIALHTEVSSTLPFILRFPALYPSYRGLQRLRMKMAPYVFIAVWRTGKTLCVPDTLSRVPVSRPTVNNEEESAVTAAHIWSLVSMNATSTDDQAIAPIFDDDRTLQELHAVES
ncbi:hypothetical protein C7M84_019222 [Penaeus vannamei]|uniref:Reverse transcriptase/retrotransposon-derived protein RNase H-like domain-containing protein n=1 Tax=Penaeus vannamei TaxID=6689 RepID=A0A3R7QC01_PENVA|nr:hypothetical protein C7M84_019222 [Penaeus vannamei]